MVDIINMGGPFSFCMFLFIIPCIRSAACKTVGFTSSRAFALGNKALFRTAHCFRVHYTIQSQDIYQNFHNYF